MCPEGYLSYEQALTYFTNKFFILQDILTSSLDILNIHKYFLSNQFNPLTDTYVLFLGRHSSYLVEFVEGCTNSAFELDYNQSLSLLKMLIKLGT